MDLASKYQYSNPWPSRAGEQVLFILDTRNAFEEEVLKGWIHHHTRSGSEEFHTPQVCLDLGDDKKGIDSAGLVMALGLPSDTLIAPLRIAWLPSKEDINSGPRLRNLLFGDPRHPSARRGRKILQQAPERMHLIAGVPDTVRNLRERFENHHNVEDSAQQQDFADFVARQAAIVLDLAERRLQGGRYKVPRHVAASLLADNSYNEALEKLARESGRSKEELIKEARTYMDEMVSRPSTCWPSRKRVKSTPTLRRRRESQISSRKYRWMKPTHRRPRPSC